MNIKAVLMYISPSLSPSLPLSPPLPPPSLSLESLEGASLPINQIQVLAIYIYIQLYFLYIQNIN